MKIVRSMVAWICLLTICFSLLPPKALGAENFEDENIVYTISYGAAYVYKCRVNSGTVEIPAYVNGYPVFGVGYQAFSQCGSLEKVIMRSEGSNNSKHCRKHWRLGFCKLRKSLDDKFLKWCYRNWRLCILWV